MANIYSERARKGTDCNLLSCKISSKQQRRMLIGKTSLCTSWPGITKEEDLNKELFG